MVFLFVHDRTEWYRIGADIWILGLGGLIVSIVRFVLKGSLERSRDHIKIEQNMEVKRFRLFSHFRSFGISKTSQTEYVCLPHSGATT